MDDILLADLNVRPAHSLSDLINFSKAQGSRYIAYLSFALQAALVGIDPAISRLINITIHLANALILAKAARLVFESSLTREDALQASRWVAWLWVLLPVHATTVLYPIQRMTLLATTSSLIVFVLILAPATYKRILAAIFLYLCAIATKENTIVALPTALTAKILLSQPYPRRKRAYHLLAMLAALLISAGILLRQEIEALFRYSAWDFELIEKLSLAPRTILEHAITITWPTGRNFSFYYDDYILQFAHPLPSAYLITLLLFPGIFLALASLSKKNPIAACGISIFILTISLETTIPAIELYADHRSYLPSIGIVIALVSLIQQLPRTRTNLLLSMYSTILLIQLAFRCYVIGNEERLTQHHLATHPMSFRAASDAARLPALNKKAADNIYGIEAEALYIRAICADEVPPPFNPNALDTKYVPKRSQRLHELVLKNCNDPCNVPEEYLYRIGNSYLHHSRNDSYKLRIESQIRRHLRLRSNSKCSAARLN